MSYRYDRLEPADAYWWEPAEVGFAARAASRAACPDRIHDYLPNLRGGGTCRWCGDELGIGEPDLEEDDLDDC